MSCVPCFLPNCSVFTGPKRWLSAKCLPKLECGSRALARSHGRRPPGGRPRTVAGGSRARPQAAARQAAGAAA
eukprot:scaffold31259_cov69-Phaeocystis_antarctica.AAC.1